MYVCILLLSECAHRNYDRHWILNDIGPIEIRLGLTPDLDVDPDANVTRDLDSNRRRPTRSE
jgi:hypothetical protein